MLLKKIAGANFGYFTESITYLSSSYDVFTHVGITQHHDDNGRLNAEENSSSIDGELLLRESQVMINISVPALGNRYELMMPMSANGMIVFA